MRLTNVAHLGLEEGRLLSHPLTSGPPGAALPVSFDQRRHVGAGDRPGSWMAISLHLATPPHRDVLAAAWLAVVRRHGTLHSTFAGSRGSQVLLHDVAVDAGEWVEHEVGPGRAVRDVLREVLDAACRPCAPLSHRLCLVEHDDGAATLVLASDHAHVDLWSLLVVARDLLESAADLQEGREPGAALPLVPDFAAHTAELEARERAPDAVRQRWADVLDASGGLMPRFPLPLGDLAQRGPGVVEVRDVLDATQAVALAAHARRHGVRALTVVVGVLTEVAARLAGAPLRAVFPVHSRYDAGWHDAVGWFITNAVLECDDPDLGACADAIRTAVELGSWPLADVLADHGGMPTTPGMFAVSWLDSGRLPVRLDPATEPRYVGAVVDTDDVMVWFLSGEDGLHLRCRYPGTPEAADSVGRWLDAVVAGLRSTVDPTGATAGGTAAGGTVAGGTAAADPT